MLKSNWNAISAMSMDLMLAPLDAARRSYNEARKNDIPKPIALSIACAEEVNLFALFINTSVFSPILVAGYTGTYACFSLTGAWATAILFQATEDLPMPRTNSLPEKREIFCKLEKN